MSDAISYVLRVTGVRKSFGKKNVLQGVDLAIPQGKSMATSVIKTVVCSTAPLVDFSNSGGSQQARPLKNSTPSTLTPTQADSAKDAAPTPAPATKAALGSVCSQIDLTVATSD